MNYYKQYKGEDKITEITKEEARRTLEGWWIEDALNDIFDNGRMFRLYTAYADVWTKDEQGRVPMAGFYGIVG